MYSHIPVKVHNLHLFALIGLKSAYGKANIAYVLLRVHFKYIHVPLYIICDSPLYISFAAALMEFFVYTGMITEGLCHESFDVFAA